MRRGVTLLEVLVAGLLLGIGLVAGLNTIGQAAATARQLEDRERALMLARSKMEEILKEPVLQMGSDQGQGEGSSAGYEWQAVIEASQHPSLVVVVVTARNRQTDVTVSLSALRRPDLMTAPDGTSLQPETGGLL